MLENFLQEIQHAKLKYAVSGVNDTHVSNLLICLNKKLPRLCTVVGSHLLWSLEQT